MRYLFALTVLSSVAFAQVPSSAGPTSAPDQSERPAAILENALNTLPDFPPPPRGKATVIGGAIRRVDRVRDQLTLDVFGGKAMKILFDERTQVYRDGLKASLHDLQDGERVSVETVLDETAVFARSIRMLTRSSEGECSGQVLDFNRRRGLLVVRDALSPEPVKLQVFAGTTIVRVGQATASSNDLERGTLVSVKFRPSDNGQQFAHEIAILATPGTAFVFAGRVSFLDLHAGRLVLVDPRDQKHYEIFFDPRMPVSSSLHEGAEVTVTAGFDGSRYTANAIAVNSGSSKITQD